MKNLKYISNFYNKIINWSFCWMSFQFTLTFVMLIKFIVIYIKPWYQDLPIIDNLLITFLSDCIFIIIFCSIILINHHRKWRTIIVNNFILLILLIIYCADLFYIFFLGSRVSIKEIYNFIVLWNFWWFRAFLWLIFLWLLLYVSSLIKINEKKFIIWFLIISLFFYILDWIYLLTTNKSLTNENSDNILLYSIKSYLNNDIKTTSYNDIN